MFCGVLNRERNRALVEAKHAKHGGEETKAFDLRRRDVRTTILDRFGHG